jgi:glycine cleavage system aminomethyltransferase T
VAQTSVAKTHQLIIRADVIDLPAYRLIGGRALGAYVWDTLMEAGRDLQLSPIGCQALERLT